MGAINELRALHKKAEKDIANILSTLQRETSLKFSGLDVRIENIPDGLNKIVSVQIKLEL